MDPSEKIGASQLTFRAVHNYFPKDSTMVCISNITNALYFVSGHF